MTEEKRKEGILKQYEDLPKGVVKYIDFLITKINKLVVENKRKQAQIEKMKETMIVAEKFNCSVNALNKNLEEQNEQLKVQIEKMKCCSNCKYGYCGGSSVSIDENGNKTFHNWNEEKEEYCDIGYQGKYQCWEL